MAQINSLFRRIGFLFLITAMAASTLSAAPALSAKVNPLVWEDTANGKTGNFLVILRQQVDLNQLALGAASWHEQGLQVVNGLRQTAQASQAGVLAELNRLGASYRAYWISNLVAVQAGRGVVNALAARADVAAIEPDRAFHARLETLDPAAAALPDDTQSVEWNITKVRAPEMWALGFTGQGGVYANADTGVSWTHPALKTHYRGWDGAAADHNFNWWDAIKSPIVGGSTCGYDTQAPCDDYGHGTHTMGTGVGSDGLNNQTGIAPGAKWIACRNMDGGVGRPSTYIDCLQFFIAPTDLAGQNANPDLRPDAIGNSYGCPPDEQCGAHDLQAAVAAVRAAGIFMTASAGNDGPSCSSITTPPALEPGVFTVAATDSSDNVASFSSRGPVTVDGSNLRKPDLSAPGANVRSSVPGGGYGSMSGTSMASPHVAGAVVLLWSADPLLRGNVSLTESLLEQSAVARTSNQGCGGDLPSAVPNNVYGYGRLDVRAAYALVYVAAPSALTALPVSRSAIDLQWQDNSSNEDGFQIERSLSGQNSWELAGTTGVGENHYHDSGLSAYTNYDYRVRAFNNTGISTYTAPASAATQAYLVQLPLIQR